MTAFFFNEWKDSEEIIYPQLEIRPQEQSIVIYLYVKNKTYVRILYKRER